MEEMIITLGLMSLMLILGMVLGSDSDDISYENGWQDGAEAVINALPEACVRALAEEAVKDPGMQMHMQMMVDCERGNQ